MVVDRVHGLAVLEAEHHAPVARDSDAPLARTVDHPVESLSTFARILRADAYAGCRRLHQPGRSPGLVTEALLWSHGRRKFHELDHIAANKRRGKNASPISPPASEAVTRIDAIFDIERTTDGETAERSLAARRERNALPVAGGSMHTVPAGLPRRAAAAKATDSMLKRRDGVARFLDEGHVCPKNDAAERALRPLGFGREFWPFARSDRGGERAAGMYALIGTAKLNDVERRAWLADVLDRIANLPKTRLHERLPWHRSTQRQRASAA